MAITMARWSTATGIPMTGCEASVGVLPEVRLAPHPRASQNERAQAQTEALMPSPALSPMMTLAALTAMGTALASHAAEVPNRVVIQHGPLTVDHSQGIADITRAQARGGFRAVHGAQLGLGLFQNRMTTTLEPASAPGKPLALVTRIKTEPVIYIAREFPADSCAYRVVLAHERQHYLYDRDVLRDLAGEVRGITRAVFVPPPPANEAELEQARKLFFQQFNHAYEGLSFPLHSRIDNPAAYAELAALCKGEIRTRLGEKP